MFLHVRMTVSPETFGKLVVASRGAGFARKNPRRRWSHSERLEAAAMAVRAIVSTAAAKLEPPAKGKGV